MVLYLEAETTLASRFGPVYKGVWFGLRGEGDCFVCFKAACYFPSLSDSTLLLKVGPCLNVAFITFTWSPTQVSENCSLLPSSVAVVLIHLIAENLALTVSFVSHAVGFQIP